ncbi:MULTISPECIES: MFS transporter [Acidobacterium]|uniref:Transporter, major facilitator family n=1 Tax=Acidobacterium capsulatum (strain ATCC 51196 / DSM 11244 / BCRC 80197 / JCM 7670 / NBRC 15755 / NCIMB 13165 / 161) TaxID=240015 RepID=C1FA42_ACIC5|nr:MULTISPECIES: MFS transporter [Acidobacterium]ACO32778.1 transporter, major facilitator family [Acidobacterium capsulatum ATCC 51196]
MSNSLVTFATKYQLRPSIILLYLGFLVTGALTVLLGVVLPKVAAVWHLTDTQSGTLLMTLFAGSSLGALFVRKHFQRTLTYGYLLVPASGLLWMAAPRLLAVPAIFLYGVGLGMAMTSTSMLVGRLFPQKRGAALSFLNFCWSIGSTLCPLLIARAPNHLSPAALGVAVAVTALPFAALPLLGGLQAKTQPSTPGRGLDRSFRTLALFAIAGFIYVGIESAVGGWLTTFALRTVAWSYARSSLTAACFWGAVLAGRGLTPLVLEGIREVKLFRLAVLALMAGLGMLVAAHSAWLLLAGTVLTGLALAPIFPLVLSLFMARAGESKHTGWVFMLSGFGGAVMPWMTGVLSTGTHSLRIGLLVPFAASLVLLAMMLWFGLTQAPAAREAAEMAAS